MYPVTKWTENYPGRQLGMHLILSRKTLDMHLIFVSSIHMRVTQLIGKESWMENQIESYVGWKISGGPSTLSHNDNETHSPLGLVVNRVSTFNLILLSFLLSPLWMLCNKCPFMKKLLLFILFYKKPIFLCPFFVIK